MFLNLKIANDRYNGGEAERERENVRLAKGVVTFVVFVTMYVIYVFVTHY